MGADIRKAVDLLLGVSLKEERFSQEREWDSGAWFVEEFGEGCWTNRGVMMMDEHPALVENRL